MKTKTKTSILALSVALAGGFGAGGAMAQTASPTPPAEPQAATVDDIVVTANRRSQNLQDVPMAINAIGGQALENKGIVDTASLSAIVPNLQVSSPYGKTQPNFSLRGVSVANEFNANQASPNGVYLDEVYLSARFAQGMNLFDLERVEVVKGPQGTLYGRNTVGGAINIITRKAEFAPLNGFVEGGYGNFNRWSLTGAAGGTLVEDRLAFRIAGTVEKGDGQLKNLFPGNPDERSIDNYAIRGSLLWKPTDDLSFLVRAYAGESNPTGEPPFVIGSGPGGVNPITGYSRPKDMGFYETATNYVGHNRAQASGVSVTGKLALGAWDLISITAYDKGELRVDQDADGGPVDEFNINWYSDYEQFSQDIRIASDPSRPVRGIIGAYYGWDQNKTFNTYDFFGFLEGVPGLPAFDPPNIFAPPPYPGLFGGVPGVFSGFNVDHRFTQTRKSAAIYGDGNWDITDRLTLTAGLRYTRDDLELTDVSSTARNYAGVPQFNFIPFLAPPGSKCPDTPGCPSLETNSSSVTGRLILNYDVAEDVLAYVSYSRGYRSGAINGTAYASPAQLTFVEPEEVTAYEIGLKSRFLDRRLRMNGAVFFYDYKNQQLQEIVGIVPFLRNAPEGQVLGVDFDATFAATNALTFNLGFGYLDSEYKKLVLAGVDLSGNVFSNAPEMTLNADAEIRLFDNGESAFIVRPNVVYTGHTWLSPFNDKNGNANLQQDGYWVANLQASYERGPLSIGAYVKNIFEEEYFSYGLDLRNSIGVDFLVRGERRTYGLNARYRF